MTFGPLIPPRYGGGSGGGTGFALGPAPNLFADAADNNDSPTGRARGPAANKADAEALRQVYEGRNHIFKTLWKSGGNSTTALDFMHLISQDTFAQVPWGTGAAWVLPAGSEFNWAGKSYTTQSAVTIQYRAASKTLMLHTVKLDRNFEDAFRTGTLLPDGDLIPTLATWLDKYDKTGLATKLYYKDTGNTKVVQYQVYSSPDGWANVGSPVAVIPGEDGLPGDRTDFSAIPTNHIPAIDDSHLPVDSGVSVSGGEVIDPSGKALAPKADIPTSFPWGQVTGKSDVALKTDIPTDFPWADVSGKPTLYTDAAFETRLEALISGGSGDNVGGQLVYDKAAGKLSVVVGSNHPVPVISNFEMTGSDRVYTSNHSISGSHTWTWSMANTGSISGDLTLEQKTFNASTNVSATTSLTTSIQSDATSFTGSVQNFDLNDVGSYVEFTLKGQSVNSVGFQSTFKIERQAASAQTTMYWGMIPDSGDAADFADATQVLSDQTYIDAFDVNIQDTKNLSVGEKVDGDYTINRFVGNFHIAFLIPKDRNALSAITDLNSPQFPQLNTFTYIAPSGSSGFHRYISATDQNGDYYPKTFTLTEST